MVSCYDCGVEFDGDVVDSGGLNKGTSRKRTRTDRVDKMKQEVVEVLEKWIRKGRL